MNSAVKHSGILRASGSRLRPALGAFAAMALAWGAQPAHAAYVFQDIINPGDVTFNQEFGINNAGKIAGYFGSGMAVGYPNKGYTTVPPSYNTSFTNENFPNSAQTQVTGINNVGTTVGFWSDTNLGSGDNNFGFTDVGGTFTNVNNPGTGVGPPAINQLLGVNDSNIAVGFYVDGAGTTHGYTYNIGAMTFSGNIDDPNGVGATTAAAINNAGEIAGFYTDRAGSFTASSIMAACSPRLIRPGRRRRCYWGSMTMGSRWATTSTRWASCTACFTTSTITRSKISTTRSASARRRSTASTIMGSSSAFMSMAEATRSGCSPMYPSRRRCFCSPAVCSAWASPAVAARRHEGGGPV